MVKLKIPNLGLNIKKINFSKLSKPGRVLVLQSTGGLLYGAVASCTTSSAFSFGAVVLSSGTDRTAAVGEVLAQLKSQFKQRLPKTAILLSPSVAATLLTLPVDPKKPRPPAQMAELVRWELEELTVQQNELWTLGALLMDRGDLDYEQRRSVESRALAEKQRPSAALYQGTVDSAALEACLGLQEQLLGDDESQAAGWIGQVAGEEDEEAGEEGFSWLVAGVGSSQCESWAKACRKHGIFLSRIYPRLGACLTLVEATEEWMLVDVGQEQWGVVSGQGRRLAALTYKPCVHGRAVVTEVVETVGDLLRPQCSTVHLSAPAGQWAELAAALKLAYGKRGVRIVAPGGDDEQMESGERLAAMIGAARCALGLTAKALPLVSVVAQEPRPPLWKRKELWPWVTIGALVIGLTATDIHVRLQVAKDKAQLTRLEIEFERKLQLKKQSETAAAEARKLESQLAVRQVELQEAERLRSILDTIIRHRQDLVPGLLQALGDSTSELVMLDQLEESADRSTIYLTGWALTDTDGQQFANALNENLQPWKYRVKDIKLARGKGRLGIDGYQLNIWLVQSGSPGDKKAPAAQAPAPPPAEKKQATPVKKTGKKGAQAHG